MFREKLLSAEQLRAKFLEIAEGESWFTEFYRPTDEATASSAAAAAASSEYDGGAEQARQIRLLFGSEPYEFLLPGDAPERLVSSERSRQRHTTRRPPDSSEYAGMRANAVSYSSVPSKAQFVDSYDEKKQRRYWLTNSDALMTRTDPSEIYEYLCKAARDYQTNGDGDGSNLQFMYALPVRTKRENPDIGIPRVEDEFIMYYVPVKRGRQPEPLPVARMVIDRVEVAPRRSTGTVTIRIKGSV